MTFDKLKTEEYYKKGEELLGAPLSPSNSSLVVDGPYLQEGDILIVTFSEECDVETVNEVHKALSDCFPHNTIIANRPDIVKSIQIVHRDVNPFDRDLGGVLQDDRDLY